MKIQKKQAIISLYYLQMIAVPITRAKYWFVLFDCRRHA